MHQTDLAAIRTGDQLPPLSKPPLTRTTLALFAGASNDHNPLHIDIDFARQAGLPDVIAHGMLPCAYLAQLLTNWVPQAAIRTISVRFSAMTKVGEAITCTGSVKEVFGAPGARQALLDVRAANADGEVKISGTATIALD